MALTQEHWVSSDHGGPKTASVAAAVPEVAMEAQPGLVLLLQLLWLLLQPLLWLPPPPLPTGAVSRR